MTVTARQEVRQTTEPAVVRAVQTPASVCGDCMFHIPHATKAGGWCARDEAELRWQSVSPEREACRHAGFWAEGSPVPAFLAAMRF